MLSTPSNRRLVLVDGHGLAFRAFFALPSSMATASGEVTNATFGFTSMLLEVLRQHTPDYLLVTFDVGRTFRHEQFADYKAHRRPMPDELPAQVDRIRDVLSALNVPVYEADGFEADDVIGTLARQADGLGLEAWVITGDSDLLQLVTDNVKVVMPGKMRFGDYRIFDHDAVVERYGFGPEYVADYKALVGDKSDNIPGVPGIGEKTAKALIQQFGSLSTIYDHVEQVTPPRARNTISQNREAAFQSLELATIVQNVPVELDLDRCVVHDFDRASVVKIFQALEFNTLVNRLPEPSSTQPPPDGPSGPDTGFVAVTHDELSQVADAIKSAETVAIDVETDSTNAITARLVGMSVAVSPEESWYVPLAHDDGPNADLELARSLVGPVLRAHAGVIAHNGKFDLEVLERHGFGGVRLANDTMLAAYILNERVLGLKDLAFTKLGWEMTPIENLIGKGKAQRSMNQVAVEQAAPYACADVQATMRLAPILMRELEVRGQVALLQEMDLPLIPVLVKMERAGIALDVPFLQELEHQLRGQIQEIRAEIFEAVGHEFNLNSPSQLASVLFEEIGLPSGKKTKTGFSVSQDVLENLKGAHDAVDLILEYRTISKIMSTYVETLPQQINPETGRVHTNYNQTIAATGRLSSTDPNLQNIPVRSRLGREVRRAFVADNHGPMKPYDEETVLFGADYSQMELRILAHFCQDPALVTAFREDRDVHSTTAAEVFGVPIEDVTPEQRSVAKTVNFGIIYGMQAFGLSRDTGMSRQDSQEFISRYYARFPGIRSYFDAILTQGVQDGYTATLFNRRRYLPDLSSRGPQRAAAERAAMNMPLQGAAADIMKLAMIEIDKQLQASRLKSRMLLQVHDELIFEAPVSEVADLADLVARTMVNVVELSVPLEVERKVGLNWGEMKPYAA